MSSAENYKLIVLMGAPGSGGMCPLGHSIDGRNQPWKNV